MYSGGREPLRFSTHHRCRRSAWEIASTSILLVFFSLFLSLRCLVSFQGLVSDVSIVVLLSRHTLLSPYGTRVWSFATTVFFFISLFLVALPLSCMCGPSGGFPRPGVMCVN